jgi:hypothetical protein
MAPRATDDAAVYARRVEDVEDDEPSVPFEGTVRRSHTLEPGSTVLILERYAGDIEVGNVITVLRAGTTATAKVVTVAWGSSFGYESPPLTLVVKGLEASESWAGAELKSEARDV